MDMTMTRITFSDISEKVEKDGLGSLSEKKYGIFWEFFPYGEGGSHQIPKSF